MSRPMPTAAFVARRTIARGYLAVSVSIVATSLIAICFCGGIAPESIPLAIEGTSP